MPIPSSISRFPPPPSTSCSRSPAETSTATASCWRSRAIPAASTRSVPARSTTTSGSSSPLASSKSCPRQTRAMRVAAAPIASRVSETPSSPPRPTASLEFCARPAARCAPISAPARGGPDACPQTSPLPTHPPPAPRGLPQPLRPRDVPRLRGRPRHLRLLAPPHRRHPLPPPPVGRARLLSIARTSSHPIAPSARGPLHAAHRRAANCLRTPARLSTLCSHALHVQPRIQRSHQSPHHTQSPGPPRKPEHRHCNRSSRCLSNSLRSELSALAHLVLWKFFCHRHRIYSRGHSRSRSPRSIGRQSRRAFPALPFLLDRPRAALHFHQRHYLDRVAPAVPHTKRRIARRHRLAQPSRNRRR